MKQIFWCWLWILGYLMVKVRKFVCKYCESNKTAKVLIPGWKLNRLKITKWGHCLTCTKKTFLLQKSMFAQNRMACHTKSGSLLSSQFFITHTKNFVRERDPSFVQRNHCPNFQEIGTNQFWFSFMTSDGKIVKNQMNLNLPRWMVDRRCDGNRVNHQ